jgi:glycosyltransferase involved in cell wall biosynthesis
MPIADVYFVLVPVCRESSPLQYEAKILPVSRASRECGPCCQVLRIGVDASYGTAKAGIARYLDCMVAEMLALDPSVEFVFYAPRPVEIALPQGRWRLRTESGLRGRFVNPWVQTRIPGWAAEDGLDVFWGQNNVLPLRLRRRCFRLLTVHDLAPFVCPKTLRFESALTRRYYSAMACRAADAVVADSDATARDIVRLLGIRRDKVTRVYFGVSGNFQPVPTVPARDVAAGKYGLPNDYLLTVGTIEPRKHHTVLLHALRLLQSAPLLAIIGGVGWKAESIMREITVMERAGRVRYLGWVDDSDLPALYSAAKMLVLPSSYEGFGLPVLEAMSCGCPVLCSWSSSLPEVGGDAARYFRVGDSEDTARKLKELLIDEKQRAAMAAAGLVRAKQFSFRQAAQKVLDIMSAGAAQLRRRNPPTHHAGVSLSN